MTLTAGSRVETDAYAVLAPVYDLLTGGYAYDRWVGSLLDLAARHGLNERRALDVACGTGRSFMPLLERGYEVVGCDSSPRCCSRPRTAPADARRCTWRTCGSCPASESSPLVTCLDDAVNHLDSELDLLHALRGMRANLSRGGVLIFDVNLLSAYADVPGTVLQDDGRLVCWTSSGRLIERSGGAAEVVIDVFARAAGDLWRHSRAVQRHRHFAVSTVKELAARAGLEVLAVHGQRPARSWTRTSTRPCTTRRSSSRGHDSSQRTTGRRRDALGTVT